METFDHPEGAEDMEKENSALSVIYFLISFIFSLNSISSATPASSFSPPSMSLPFS